MQILTMISKQLKLLFSNRLTILATIAVPLVLTYLFSLSANTTQQKLYIADLDKSSSSKQLISLLSAHKDLNIVLSSEAEINKQINNQNISLGLVIDKAFSQSLAEENSYGIRIIENHEDSASSSLEQIISSELSILKKLSQDSNYLNSSLAGSITNDLKNSSGSFIKDESKNNGSTLRFIGFLAMFIWFAIAQGLRTLLDEKENKTLERLLSLPIKYNKYLLSKIIACYIFALLNLLAMLAAGQYFLKISLGANLLPLVAILSAYILLLTGITLLIVLFAKKHQSFTISYSILIASTGILGGSFFSLDIAPSYMQTISKITPEAWAIQSSSNIIVNSSSLTSQAGSLIVLVAAAIIFFLLSSAVSSRKLKF